MNLKMLQKYNMNRKKVGAIFLIFASMYLIFIFLLISTQNYRFLLSNSADALPAHMIKVLIPGWLHFLINAVILGCFSFLSLKFDKIKFLTLLYISCLFVFILDLLGTQIYYKILPTPLIPAFFVALSFMIFKKNLYRPEFKKFSELNNSSKCAALYGMSLIVIGSIQLFVTLNGTIIPTSSINIDNANLKLLLAASHITSTNMIGFGLICQFLFMTNEFEEIFRYLDKIRLWMISISFLIIFSSSIFNLNFLILFSIPIILFLGFIWTLKLETKEKSIK